MPYILFLLLLLINKTIFSQNHQTEGIINMTSTLDPEGFRRYIWFKDSLVIYEIMTHFSESRNDTVIDEGVRLKQYTLLDLKTMHAQDYSFFSDSAEPITNYYLKKDEFVSWKFYNQKSFDKYLDSLKPTNDTIIGNKPIRRFYYQVTTPEFQYKITYGLLCPADKNIFHLSKLMDEKFPNCKTVFIQMEDEKYKFSEINKLIVVSNELTETEEKIFTKWESNLKSCPLPITTHRVAERFMSRMGNFAFRLKNK